MSDGYIKDASLVAVIATLAVVLWQRAAPPDLTVPVPGSDPVPSYSLPPDPQRIDARLWEDPFAAIARAEQQYRSEAKALLPGEKALPHHRTTPGELHDWLAQRHPLPKGKRPAGAGRRVTLIGVTRDASSRSGRQEARRRDRVALQAAMSGVDASRIDAQHVGGLAYRPAGTATDIVVPFELYERGLGNDRESFVVLWLDEDHFFRLPEPPDYCAESPTKKVELMTDIRGLFDRLAKDSGVSAQSESPDVRRMVLGPRTSDRLRKLAANALLREPSHRSAEEGRPEIELYAYSPTAASSALLEPLLGKKGCTSPAPTVGAPVRATSMEEALEKHGVRLTRTIADDERVLEALRREIEVRVRSRIVMPPQSAALTFVTLVSVGDLYAWKLAQSFDEQMAMIGGRTLDPSRSGTGSPGDPGDAGKPPAASHRYLFMRELNDRTRSSPDQDDDAPGGGRGRLPPAGRHRASAQDNQQFDYVERLADRIARDLGTGGSASAPPFAIAIFGADPNDRITLIRAMKRRFPGSLFVTTDLDARYLDPDNITHTRNMLIGSAFDLEPSDAKRSSFAPFRDAYQTAFYSTLVQALPPPSTKVVAHDVTTWPGPNDPSVYEVGLGKFILVSPGRQTEAPHRPFPWMAGIAFAVGSLLVILLATWVVRSPRLPADRAARNGREWWRSADRGDLLAIAWLGIVGILLFAWLAWLAGTAGLETWGSKMDGEPADWNQGVSIWGAIAVRSLGCCLVGVLLFQFVGIYYDEIAGIGRPTPPAREGWLASALWKAVRVWRLQAHDRPRSDRNAQGPSQSATEISDRYVLMTAPRQTIVIAVVRVAMLALVMEFLLWIGGQPADVARSETSGLLYFWSGRISAWLLFLLLTVSMHIYSECGAWMHRLAGSEAALCRVTWEQERRDRMVSACRLTQHDPDGPCLDRLLDAAISLERIRDHTEIIGRFIYAPFIVLGVLLVSTWQGFEYFQWPVGAQILLGIVVIVALINAVALELVATRVKRNITSMIDHELPLLLATHQDDSPLRRQLEPLAADLRNVDEGAFAPMLRQPVVRALSFPGFAGAALTLIDMFLAT